MTGTAEAPSGRLVALLAFSCGGIVANIYYAQPLIGLIAPDLHLTTGQAGLIVTLTQLGYGVGLVGIASLADLVENRRLAVLCMAATVCGLLLVARAHGPAAFLSASFVVGLGAVATQVLVPLAAHLSPERTRGRVVGNVMAGLLAGIMLARPAASMLAAYGGWRIVFIVAAILMAGLALLLRLRLPSRAPRAGLHYGQILATMGHLLLTERVLQKRAAYQALMFAAFNLFWTAAPLLLAHRFGLGQRGIAVFALAGAGGALAAPVAGRLADRGWTEATSAAAMASAAASFVLAGWGAWVGSLPALVAAAIVLDAAVQTNQVCGQRVIYGLDAAVRGRLNAVYIACLFAGGALGSLLATSLYAAGGFGLTATAGAGAGLIALMLLKTWGSAPDPAKGLGPLDPIT